MNDHRLVEALREREPGVQADVYDAYADRLYAYCWFQLRSRDAAQMAIRDTFVLAEAHIGELRDPDRFGPWLYAIARLECARRIPYREQPPDVPVASHDQEDVDRRIMAWQAVLALRPLSRETLELRVRHQLSVPDMAMVYDVPLKDAQSVLDRAHSELEGTLTAEILAHHGPYGCAERALMLRERCGELVHEVNSRLMEHTEDCAICGALRPRTVSAAKVYGLLPETSLPPELRLRVMNCFLDPELVGYRIFVATRITEFTLDGFPVQSGQPTQPPQASRPDGLFRLRRFRRKHSKPKEGRAGKGRALGDGPEAARPGSRAVRFAVVPVVVALLSGAGIASMYGFFDLGRQDADRVAEPRPSVVPGLSEQPGFGQRPGEHPNNAGGVDAAPISATFPLGAQAPSAPPTLLRPSSTEPAPVDEASDSTTDGVLMVSPLFLDLAGRSQGSIDLRAEHGPVAWRSTSRGPVRTYPPSGRLRAGQSTTVRVYVRRRSNSRGHGIITFRPGGDRVSVTWRPDAPGEGPTPSPTVTESGPGNPSKPPFTRRPGNSPTPSKRPSSPGPPPYEPRPSSKEPESLPSTESSGPSTTAPPITNTPPSP